MFLFFFSKGFPLPRWLSTFLPLSRPFACFTTACSSFFPFVTFERAPSPPYKPPSDVFGLDSHVRLSFPVHAVALVCSLPRMSFVLSGTLELAVVFILNVSPFAQMVGPLRRLLRAITFLIFVRFWQSLPLGVPRMRLMVLTC